MSINVKKYTKEQMAKMVEEATERQEAAEAEATAHFKAGVKLAEENEKLRGEIGTLLNARERAHYAEAHPWRNLWAWVKRKLGGERNEHVS